MSWREGFYQQAIFAGCLPLRAYRWHSKNWGFRVRPWPDTAVEQPVLKIDLVD